MPDPVGTDETARNRLKSGGLERIEAGADGSLAEPPRRKNPGVGSLPWSPFQPIGETEGGRGSPSGLGARNPTFDTPCNFRLVQNRVSGTIQTLCQPG